MACVSSDCYKCLIKNGNQVNKKMKKDFFTENDILNIYSWIAIQNGLYKQSPKKLFLLPKTNANILTIINKRNNKKNLRLFEIHIHCNFNFH